MDEGHPLPIYNNYYYTLHYKYKPFIMYLINVGRKVIKTFLSGIRKTKEFPKSLIFLQEKKCGY